MSSGVMRIYQNMLDTLPEGVSKTPSGIFNFIAERTNSRSLNYIPHADIEGKPYFHLDKKIIYVPQEQKSWAEGKYFKISDQRYITPGQWEGSILKGVREPKYKNINMNETPLEKGQWYDRYIISDYDPEHTGGFFKGIANAFSSGPIKYAVLRRDQHGEVAFNGLPLTVLDEAVVNRVDNNSGRRIAQDKLQPTWPVVSNSESERLRFDYKYKNFTSSIQLGDDFDMARNVLVFDSGSDAATFNGQRYFYQGKIKKQNINKRFRMSTHFTGGTAMKEDVEDSAQIRHMSESWADKGPHAEFDRSTMYNKQAYANPDMIRPNDLFELPDSAIGRATVSDTGQGPSKKIKAPKAPKAPEVREEVEQSDASSIATSHTGSSIAG